MPQVVSDLHTAPSPPDRCSPTHVERRDSGVAPGVGLDRCACLRGVCRSRPTGDQIGTTSAEARCGTKKRVSGSTGSLRRRVASSMRPVRGHRGEARCPPRLDSPSFRSSPWRRRCRPASARARRSRRLHPSKSGARPFDERGDVDGSASGPQAEAAAGTLAASASLADRLLTLRRGRIRR